MAFSIKEKKTGQCCEKESTEGNPKFEDKVEDAIQGSVGTDFPEIPISPFPEISGIITKVEKVLHVKIGLFGSGNIEGSLSGSETTQDCDKSVEGEISGGLAVKIGLAGKFTLPADILSAQVKGEWGLSAKIGGNSSEIGTKIFFHPGPAPLPVGYEFTALDGLLHFGQSFEVLPAGQLPVFCILHPKDTPWTNLTSCPSGG